MKLVYDIFDHYMAQNDKLFLFYMVTGVIIQNKDVSIWEAELILEEIL